MSTLATLKPRLSRLKLSGILDTLETRLSQALEEKWDYSQFLEALLSDEVERRDNKQLSRRLARSGLQPEKTLAAFDWSFNAGIHKPTIRELATCAYLERHQNIFFVGPSGVGKSHLAQALGHEACQRSVDVLFRNTFDLFKWIHAGNADGSHERRLQLVISMPLLILDDYGLRSLSESQQADLYEVISGRYERASTIITSNRDFAEWPAVFSNPLMGSAAMDRLVHRAIRITIEGKSYRLSSFVESTKFLTGEANQGT
jgi:DNA replication protein DnaC